MNTSIELNSSDHRQGNKNARVTLIEYGDYECPNCGTTYPTIKKLQRYFAEELIFAFRNFPLLGIHRYALEAACAAEAAGRQGKFWPMHDLIFENQSTLCSRQLLNLGRVIGVNVEQLAIDMKSAEVKNKIESDMESGIKNDVHGTPTFFINGNRFDGYHDFESLQEAINMRPD